MPQSSRSTNQRASTESQSRCYLHVVWADSLLVGLTDMAGIVCQDNRLDPIKLHSVDATPERLTSSSW